VADASYTGQEPAISLGATGGVDSDVVFELRAPGIPPTATPVFDESLGAVVGYREVATTGVYRLYDVDGNVVGMEEKGLESPSSTLSISFSSLAVFSAPWERAPLPESSARPRSSLR